MSIDIRNIQIGKGMPKICIPITGVTREEIRKQLIQIQDQPFDLLEWRGDFFSEIFDPNAVRQMLHEIRTDLANKPLLFTFRTKWEGGEREISEETYEELNSFIAKTKETDLIDVELFRTPQRGKRIKKILEAHGIKMVGSNHDFEKTPPEQELIERLETMKRDGADIPKIAVMPKRAEDVAALLNATLKFHIRYPDIPVITMAMGNIGIISRMAGEVFGSSVTFASGAAASAPGQIPAKNLQDILKILHKE